MSGSLLDAFLQEDAVLLTSKREVYLAIRRDGGGGADGSRGNPLDASTRQKLDAILGATSAYMLPNTRFVFGPGIFRTAGIEAWQPLEGQEFIGSSISATTLRLEVPIPLAGGLYVAIGSSDPTDGIIIREMTIDCNLGGQANPSGWDYPAIGCGAVFLAGSQIKVQRVRVINGGSRYPAFYGNEGINLSFYNTSPLSDLLIEDCVIEQPFHSLAREMPCMALQGYGAGVWYKNTVVRNNMIDCAFVNPGPFAPVPIQKLDGNTDTLVTLTQHDLKSGDKVVIDGAGLLDGTYAVSSVTDAVNAVRYDNCTAIKFFNNQDTNGALLRGYDTGPSKYNYADLEDLAEDVLLPL